MTNQVVIELIGADRYEGPEGFWVAGLYQLVNQKTAEALLKKKNTEGQPLFQVATS